MRLVLPGRAVGALHHDVRSGECLVEVAGIVYDFCDHVAVTADVSTARHHEAVPIGMHQARTWGEGLLGRGDGLDRLDVEHHRPSAGLGSRSALGNHDRHGLALVGHIIRSQQRSVRHDHPGSPVRHVRRRQHLEYAADPECGRWVDRPDPAGSHRRPGKCRPQHPDS